MNYGYILQEEKTTNKFSIFRRMTITRKEMYKSSGNTLDFFYLPYSKNTYYEEKSIKKLVELLKQNKTQYIVLEQNLLKYISFFKNKGFDIIDGTFIKKYLLVQAFYSYIKTNQINIQTTGVHLCANNMNDICFFFDEISKINTMFTMCTENEKFYDNIFKKYGIAVHFTDNVINKIIICYNGEIPYNTNSKLIDLSTGNYKITCNFSADLFSKITPAVAELLIRMNYSSCDTGFYDSGTKITYF